MDEDLYGADYYFYRLANSDMIKETLHQVQYELTLEECEIYHAHLDIKEDVDAAYQPIPKK